jgi:menaquinone-9 beta-reductase
MSAVNLHILDRLGVGADVRRLAGPEVRRVALFASGPSIEASMPEAQRDSFGRALGRDVLDTIMLEKARSIGVTVFQPWRAIEIAPHRGQSYVRIETRTESRVLTAAVVIAAHGSWEPGKLTTNLEKVHGSTDFLGFKAHFHNATLANDLMPLLVFPGGYGGMVWADNGRLSLSCCIRRDAMEKIRQARRGLSAAEAVHGHILSSCPAAEAVLQRATLAGDWLSSGPIRPGMRTRYGNDIFRVGNLAGESHPIIAEGISMALQSGWLLAQALGTYERWDIAGRAEAGARYSRAWRRQFALRIRLGAILARLAILPATANAMRLVVQAMPASLSLGATLSGKARLLPNMHM